MIPNNVKVAGIQYEIKQISGLETQFNQLGQILYTKGIIKVDSELSEDRKEQVIVHELLHGIFYEAGYEEQDEEIINRIAIVLYQVLKENQLCFKINKAPITNR